jgi:hypothetical protein
VYDRLVRWILLGMLVTPAACGDPTDGPADGAPPIVLGPVKTATLSIFGAYEIDFATGALGATGDLGLGSNYDVGVGGANAWVIDVGPVASVSDVPLSVPVTSFGRSAVASTGKGLLVRAQDGCVVAVHVVAHDNTPTSNTMTIDYARADCAALALDVTPMPAQVTCTPGYLMTGPPSLAATIDPWPAMALALGRDHASFALSLPRGQPTILKLVPTSVDPTSTVAWSGGCTGTAECDVTADVDQQVAATVAWTPMCFPGP